MNYTQRELVDIIYRRINGGDPLPDGGGLHPRDILFKLGTMRTSAVWQKHFTDRKLDGEITIDEGFLVPFDLEVLFDEDRKQYYSNLPVQPLDLPRGLGLYMIGPKEDPFTQYIVRRMGHLGISSSSPARNLNGKPFVFMEGSKVWYQNINTADFVTTSSHAKIVPGPSWLDMESDVIGFPGSMIDEVIEKCFEALTGQRQIPQDKANDGNKTP